MSVSIGPDHSLILNKSEQNTSGVYVYYSGETPIYVGKGNVADRHKSEIHFRRKWNFDRVDYYVINEEPPINHEKEYEIESWLIDLYGPVENLVGGRKK